ncbi:MAG: serine hydrolase [Paludibacteraceae bacterium]|nr:serine hydrolase [Paludibacteraceae bacterium]
MKGYWNKISLTWFSFLVFLSTLSCSAEQQHENEMSKGVIDTSITYSIDTLMNNSILKGNFPGAVVAIVQKDSIIFLKAYGNRALLPDTLPMSCNTIFDIASLSKCVGTTTAVLQLVEQGKISLEDKVNKYIPDFKPFVSDEDTVDITIQDLLTHSSGLDSYISHLKKYEKRFNGNPDSLMHLIAVQSKRNFKPGTKFMYSCLNFITLQNIVQIVSGDRLCDYVQKNVFDVLDMKHSCYFPSNVIVPSDLEIAPTEMQKDDVLLCGRVHDPLARLLNEGNSGNAGIFSTAEDLSLFCMAIMNGGAINGHRILRPETIDKMVNIPISNDSVVGRALGWDVDSSHSTLLGDHFPKHCSICHTGFTGTSIVMDLDARVAIILLTNRVHPNNGGSIKNVRVELSNIVSKMIDFE